MVRAWFVDLQLMKGLCDYVVHFTMNLWYMYQLTKVAGDNYDELHGIHACFV